MEYEKNPGFPGFSLQQTIDQVPTPVFDLPQPVPVPLVTV